MSERASEPIVAVCVLTIERQAGYDLITVRTRADVPVLAETVRGTRHAEEALQWVRDLIADHARSDLSNPENNP